MSSCTMFLKAFILAILVVNLVKCTEFVPVYIWGNLQTREEHVPALHKTSEDSFKDTILEFMKEKPKIVIFAENTLSPEDFAQRDQNGESAFPNLVRQQEEGFVTYRPHVQNAVGAIKELSNQFAEIPIGQLSDDLNVPKDDILIIDLNDARDDEHRIAMLKRHDSAINDIYNKIVESNDKVLAIYTAYHTSWVAPEEVIHKKTRSLLQERDGEDVEPKPVFFKTPEVLLYLSSEGQYVDEANNKTQTVNADTFDITSTAGETENSIIVTLKAKSSDYLAFSLNITKDESQYWVVTEAGTSKNATYAEMTKTNIYALHRFSYHCSNFTVAKKGTFQWLLPGFQIQPFFPNDGDVNTTEPTFGDAFDCVGFTTVPIWSGLFVTLILLLIMTFGLTMMMDIKTMDRFDDAKGKTITINAAE